MVETYTPDEFRAAFEHRRTQLAESQEDRQMIHRMAELVDDASASEASEQIVDLVLSGKRPSKELLETWCLGGAVFWREEHLSLGEGWPLTDCFGEDDEDLLPLGNPAEAVERLRDNWEGWYRGLCGTLFGKIPVRGADGRAVVLISVCRFGTTDMPLCVVRSEEYYMRMVRLTGTLWEGDFPNGDPMQASDDVLMQHILRAERFARK